MYRAAALLILAMTALSRMAMANERPHIVEPVHGGKAFFVAAHTVEPPANTDVDAAGSIQSAIDQTHAAGGGVVFLPPGRYRLDMPITVREAVTLRGDHAPAAPIKGTVLMVLHGQGELSASPAITLERGSGLRNVAVWYPEQKAQAIVPYPWTVRTSKTRNGNNATLQHVTLVNPYRGFCTGPEFNELHMLDNVAGTPLALGVRIDSTTDIGRLVNVAWTAHWWAESGLPGAPDGTQERKALAEHLAGATAFDIGRSDWQYLYDVRATGYGTGLRFRKGERGMTNAALFAADFRDCGTALELDAMNAIGLSAAGCRFGGRDHAVHAGRRFTSVAQFSDCRFDGPVLHKGLGALSLQHGEIGAGIHVERGTLCVLGVRFTNAGPHIRLEPKATCARILGNQFSGTPHIENDAQLGDVMAAHKSMSFREPPHFAPDYPARRPAIERRALYVVTEFGAAPELKNNAAAFTQALDRARHDGGGVVYVPPGNYQFAGRLQVPSGVELRGCFDVPHHTISGGSVLMPTAGKGNPDAPPFLRLESGAGLRGLTVWYPEQDPTNITPYPWAIQALGPRCWLVNVTLGNAYQGADFMTYPSDGHYIRYLAGTVLRRGLFVGKADTPGRVEDLQFNPHYMHRLHPDLPRPTYADGAAFENIIAFQRAHLEALVVGRCFDEHLNRNFLYAAHDGLAFRDDEGGARAKVVMHGSDTVSRPVVLDHVADAGVDFVQAQLVPHSEHAVAAIVTTPQFAGRAAFYGTQVWAGEQTLAHNGPGSVLLQQINTRSGPMVCRNGEFHLENAFFGRSLEPHVRIAPETRQARVIAALQPGTALQLDDPAERTQLALALSTTVKPRKLPEPWEPWYACEETNHEAGVSLQPSEKDGALRNMTHAACTVLAETNPDGAQLRVAGQIAEPGKAFAYFALAQPAIVAQPDAVLHYRLKPLNAEGRHVGVDLRCTDGTTLRDTGAGTHETHPGAAKGSVGHWTNVSIPLGKELAGKTVETVLVAYDHWDAAGRFAALVDAVALMPANPPYLYAVTAQPAGDHYTAPLRITLTAPKDITVRYTLDGSNPGPKALNYDGPITLRSRGRTELRFTAAHPDPVQGAPPTDAIVFAELYEID
ncbi:MAG: chitobiase/beta-hexosaminidase C-terminal domain-containing protein [Candidatus Hydrogenedentota bacterium]